MNKVNLDGLNPHQFLKLMTPVRTRTSDTGKVIELSKISFIKHVFHHIANFFQRFFQALFKSPHRWENDKQLIKHLRKGLETSLPEHLDLIKRLYREFKLRLPKQNEDLQSIRALLKSQAQKILLEELPPPPSLEVSIEEEGNLAPPLDPYEEPILGSPRQVQAKATMEIQLKKIAQTIENSQNHLNRSLSIGIHAKTNQNSILKLKTDLFLDKNIIENEIEDTDVESKDNLTDSLSRIPVFYKKQDILQEFNFLFQQENLSEEKKIWVQEELKEKIKNLPNDYMSAQDLESGGLPLHLLPPTIHQYISIGDIRILEESIEDGPLSTLIKDIKSDQYTVAFKIESKNLGIENTRELLAREILEPLELYGYFVAKTHIKVQEMEGIQGRWIEGETLPVELWKEFTKTKKELAEATFRQEPTEHLLEELAKLENKIVDFTHDLDNIQELLLADLLLCSCDTHLQQLLRSKEDSKLYNIDFARFMTPSEFSKTDEIVAVNFKSVLLDHPGASFPLSAQLKHLITKINLETLEEKYRPLVGDEKEMKKSAEVIETLMTDKNNIKGNLLALCKKYRMDPKTKAAKLKSEISRLERKERKKCFSKIHPQAYSRFIERIKILQNYVSQTSEPTLKEAFARMYPLVQPFMKILERLEVNPGLSIGIYHDENFSAKGIRTLNQIIDAAENENLATEDELHGLRETLAIIIENACCDVAEISTAVNL